MRGKTSLQLSYDFFFLLSAVQKVFDRQNNLYIFLNKTVRNYRLLSSAASCLPISVP